jgi:hypothetical protein
MGSKIDIYDDFASGYAEFVAAWEKRGIEQGAFLATGFQLQRLLDIPTPVSSFKRRSDTLIPVGYQFPFFMVLSFIMGKEVV